MSKLDTHSLSAPGPQRTFTGQSLAMISFPLGGIGAGSVGLSGRGNLIDWEILNRPNAGSRPPRTFPAVWARERGQAPVCRILQAPPTPPFQNRGHGDPTGSGEGMPHMDGAVFRGEYPFAWIDFACAALPVTVQLEAYSPFIPSEPDDSGFPAAILRYTVTNRTRNPVNATVAWSIFNLVGGIGDADRDPYWTNVEYGYGKNFSTVIDESGLRGVVLSSKKWRKSHPRYGTIALTTPNRSVSIMKSWLRGEWFNPMHEFWDTFSATGTLPDHDYGPSQEGQSNASAVGVRLSLKPGESKTATFYVTWCFPNFEKYWHQQSCCMGERKSCKPEPKPTWKNYYSKLFKDAVDVARKLHAKEPRLRGKTRAFHDALFSTTAPPYVLDAVSSQMSTLVTTTSVRLSDGTFYGFEGCSPYSGCCEGSCTHVWNYQQTLPFLFPSLERSMREADYRYNMRDDGGMCFRLQLPLGASPDAFHACVDGQLGGVIKTYRDWKVCGDDAWALRLWPRVKRALEFIWVQWDPDKDGVIDGVQHNTYDIEFVGPNPLSACFYLAALEAGARLAELAGEPEAAAEYRRIRERGQRWADKHLFNGAFYVQKVNLATAPQYQFGKGCLSDQMLGQWMASLAGLDYALDPDHVRAALDAIFRHNWRDSLRDHANAQRVYALNDEAGLLLCSWPNGGRPPFPFVYSDEVWTGIEYQVASHLILENRVEEGLKIVQGVRDRHDGIARNPWNEFECGSHYARAMAAYGLLLSLSGFTYDRGAGSLGFAPRSDGEEFRTFWALDGCWGSYSQTELEARLTVLHGALTLKELRPGKVADGAKALVYRGKSRVSAVTNNGVVAFDSPVELTEGRELRVVRPQ